MVGRSAVGTRGSGGSPYTSGSSSRRNTEPVPPTPSFPLAPGTAALRSCRPCAAAPPGRAPWRPSPPDHRTRSTSSDGSWRRPGSRSRAGGRSRECTSARRPASAQRAAHLCARRREWSARRCHRCAARPRRTGSPPRRFRSRCRCPTAPPRSRTRCASSRRSGTRRGSRRACSVCTSDDISQRNSGVSGGVESPVVRRRQARRRPSCATAAFPARRAARRIHVRSRSARHPAR